MKEAEIVKEDKSPYRPAMWCAPISPAEHLWISLVQLILRILTAANQFAA